MLICSIWFSAPSFWMGGGLESRFVGRVYGADCAVARHHSHRTQLVGALRHKPEDRGFDSQWCHWNFSLTSFRPHAVPVVDSASNRNEYQE